MNPPLRWLVYACRTDYTAEVIEIVRRRGDEIEALVDNLQDAASAEPLGDAPHSSAPEHRIVRVDALDRTFLALPVVVPLITPGHRYGVVDEARRSGFTSMPSLVDPTAIVAASASIDEGAVVNAAAVVAAEVALGRFVHVNRSASIGHHSVIEQFATLGPACVLAGRVHVGVGAFLGAGAVCAPKVRVGANALVGAGAVVVKDVPAGAVVVGNPAKVIREGDAGYGGVSVPL